MPTAEHAGAAAGVAGPHPVPARGSATRNGLALVMAAAAAALLVRHRAMLDAGSDSIAGADLAWLALASAGTLLLWTAGTISQLGSIPTRVPVLRLFAVQIAATFANHLLPAGSGGMAVNLRFLHRHGLSRGAAVGAVALNLVAGMVTHTVLLVAAVLLAPGAVAAAVPHGGAALLPHVPWLPAATAGAALAVVAVWAARHASVSVRGRWAGAAAQVAQHVAVLRSPVRAAQLWLGSLAVPVLHCLTLYAVLRSLGGTVALVPLSMAYLVASAVGAALPSPGGFGALDVALVAGLAAVGAPAAMALATVLTYRLLTVWFPLLPGACVLAVLLRRKVI